MTPERIAQLEQMLERGTICKGHIAEMLDAIKQRTLVQTEQEPVALAQEVIGCFHAAEIEGLTAALVNTSDLHLKDLVERRLMYALYAAQEIGCTNESLKEKNT